MMLMFKKYIYIKCINCKTSILFVIIIVFNYFIHMMASNGEYHIRKFCRQNLSTKVCILFLSILKNPLAQSVTSRFLPGFEL